MRQQGWRFVLGALVVMFIVAVPSYLSVRASIHVEVVQYICNLVEMKFYEYTKGLEEWADKCRAEGLEISPWESTREVLGRIQVHFNHLGISHLEVYTPVEDKRLWEGQGQEIGVQARLIEDRYVITKVLPGSMAAQAELQPGDIVEELDGEPIHSLWQIHTGRGFFTVIRGDKVFRVFLEPREVILDSSPQVRVLDPNTAVLEISSFRSPYFEEEDWKKVIRQLEPFSKVLVDIRENSGGSFVAMLRALSPFFCEPTLIGHLVQPRKDQDKRGPLLDNLAEDYQLAELDQKGVLDLVTFAGYGCVKGKVTVLTNYQTASVSEIFAHGIRKRGNARVWGEPTAGDVVLAVWYAIPHLAKGYSLSIPEATVVTHDNVNLEAQGVWPDRELEYRLSDAVQGLDSWVVEAAR
ncbi:MAG: PDZ domain-containing protein [Bdellovibrionaceae bacterium]|nr:PDZ domain-containing protein [Bdellovibrionales bacterium]MCB9085574.1 PDZ domain-containing protein [Pseudobdellovibrionaceae bacterium]